MQLYFKNEGHKEGLQFLLDQFGLNSVNDDVYYGTFAYIVSATGKEKKVIKTFTLDGSVKVEEYEELIAVYSSSEQSMLRFALQCFNSSLDDIKISDVFWSLDSHNTKVIKKAINLRY